MKKLVIFKIKGANFDNDFKVTIEIRQSEPDSVNPTILTGQLPANPQLPDNYNNWRQQYMYLANPLGLRAKVNKPIRYSLSECKESWDKLKENLNQWLNSAKFQPTKEELKKVLQDNLQDEIIFLIQTDNPTLQKLPWDVWDFREDFSKLSTLEVALSFKDFEEPDTSPNTSLENVRQVKTLSILGDEGEDNNRIKLDWDRDLFKDLPGAKIYWMEQPKLEDFEVFWNYVWDIFCYSGHSNTTDNGQDGQISINENEDLSISEIRNTLKTAIANGLKIAIFNSCDGLGLARQLADLNIPYVIVWREPVPNIVAAKFLKYFLTSFVQNKSLYKSRREARIQLQELVKIDQQRLEDKFPGITQLPVIIKTSVKDITWKELRGLTPNKNGSSKLSHRDYLLESVETSVKKSLEASSRINSMINLDKEEQPEMVQSNEVPKIGNQPQISPHQKLPLWTNAIDIFEKKSINGSLLILGNAGGGKTITLQQIAEELCARASVSSKAPIPVLLNLSSWKNDNQSIAEWIESEMARKYGDRSGHRFNKNHANQLLNDGLIAPLLDGLDELPSKRQEKCVAQINRFLLEDKPQYLVVCCRQEVYKKYRTKLALRGAVCLLPLDENKIKTYLESANRLDIGVMLQNNPNMKELAQNPFFLTMMVIALKENKKEDWSKLNNDNELREYLLKNYIAEMLKPRISDDKFYKGEPPKAQQILSWLKWLSNGLQSEGQTEFYREKIQPIWLTGNLMKSLYFLIIIWFFLLIFTLIGFLLLGKLMVSLVFGLIFGGLCLGANPRLNKNIDLLEAEKNWFPELEIWEGPVVVLLCTIIGGVIGGVVGGLFGALVGELTKGLLSGMIIFGLIAGLSQGGNASIRYFVLRLLLFLNGSAPWNYYIFLEHMTERMLLQRPVRGYQFIHGFLKEYLETINEDDLEQICSLIESN